MHQNSSFHSKQVFKKDATNLRAKGSQYKDLSGALDLLLEGPTKKQFNELNGQHDLFSIPFAALNSGRSQQVSVQKLGTETHRRMGSMGNRDLF